jgi:hypothetical protein
MYIVVASPDKISLRMFMEFFRTHIDKNIPFANANSLMLENDLKLFLKDYSTKYPEGLVSYYAKRKINLDSQLAIPLVMREWADVVLWFDLYSTEIKVVKDVIHFMGINENLWKQYIEKMGGNS